MKFKELKTLAKKRGIKGISKMNKSQLLSALGQNKKDVIDIMDTKFLENSKSILHDEYIKLPLEEQKIFNYIVYEWQANVQLMWFVSQFYYNQYGNKMKTANDKGRLIYDKNPLVKPMKCAIELCKMMKGEVVVQELEGMKFSFMSYKKLFKILTNVNYHIGEIIQSNKPRKLYFDIDGKAPVAKETILQKIMEILPDAKISISGSETKKKYSYHIVVNNYYFQNKENMIGFVAWCDKLIKDGFIGRSELDLSVYNSNSLMKCINQNKNHNEPISRIQKIMLDDNYKNHIITYLTGDEIDAEPIFRKFTSRILKAIQVKMKKGQKVKKKEAETVVGEVAVCGFESIELVDRPMPSININKGRAKVLLNHIVPDDLTYNIFLIICMWCMREGVSYTDFYNWGSGPWGFNQNEYDKWNKIYNSFSDKTINITRKHIKLILEQQYGELVDKKQEQFFNSFYTKNNCNLKHTVLKKEELIDGKYVSHHHYKDRKEKIIGLNLGMDSGKTFGTIEYLRTLCYDGEMPKPHQPSILWITHRISLKNDIILKLQKAMPRFIDYKTGRDGFGHEWNPGHMSEMNPVQLVCGLHSLHTWTFCIAHKFDIVVIDEVESIEFAFLNNKCFGGGSSNIDRIDRYKDCFNLLNYAIMFSKKVVVMDAFVSKRTTRWLNNLGHTDTDYYIVMKEENNEQKRSVQYYVDTKGKGGGGVYRWFHDIVEDLKAGKKLYVYYPHKKGSGSVLRKGIAEMGKLMCKCAGISEDKMIYHHSGHKNNDLLKENGVNEVWGQYQLILVNSCISVGVSYELQDVDSIYLCYDDFIPPRDLIQVSNRVRKPKDPILKFCSLLPISLLCNGFIPQEDEIPFYKPNELFQDEIGWTTFLTDNIHAANRPERHKQMKKALIELYEDICLEYDCIGDECLSEFWNVAEISDNGVVFGDVKYSSEFKKSVKDHPDIKSPIIEYEAIDSITKEKYSEIQLKIQKNQCSEMDIFRCDKFINESTFHKNTNLRIKRIFWGSPELRHGFKNLREMGKLLLYVFSINQDNWDNEFQNGTKRNNEKEIKGMNENDKEEYKMEFEEDEEEVDISNVIQFNKSKLTKEDRNYIYDRLYMNNDNSSDYIIRKNIINFYFGKSYHVRVKDRAEQQSNSKKGIILLEGVFYAALQFYIRNCHKTIVSKQELKERIENPKQCVIMEESDEDTGDELDVI